jgi:hypothetical protein
MRRTASGSSLLYVTITPFLPDAGVTTGRGSIPKTPLTHTQEVLGSNFIREQAIRTVFFRDFPQPFQESAGVVNVSLRYFNGTEEMEFILRFPGSRDCLV